MEEYIVLLKEKGISLPNPKLHLTIVIQNENKLRPIAER